MNPNSRWARWSGGIVMAIKQAFALAIGAALGFWAYVPTAEIKTAQIQPYDRKEVVKIVVTVSGLILAGAISGFIRLTYKDAEGGHRCQLALAHFSTGLMLALITALVIIVTEYLGELAGNECLCPVAIVGALLCVSLLFYDWYDFGNRKRVADFGQAPSS